MKTEVLDYELPDELIAQEPVEPRDHSRLLVLHRSTGEIEHRQFRDIGDYLEAGDVLIANESRVIPARADRWQSGSLALASSRPSALDGAGRRGADAGGHNHQNLPRD